MHTILISILCFGIIAGRNATTDGYVYLGHNEDQWGEQMLNIYNVPATKDRVAYLWFEFPGQASGDSYANEYGVCIASDQCKSREDRATGSVLYEVRTTAIQKARTAREAVHIIGSLINRYGYADSGRSYLVADQKEGWVVAVVKGKHWVAQRVPDDEIATIPNYYTIGEINLKDTVNFLGSKDIIKYARKRGWYNPKRDGAFNFRKAYADPETLTDSHNIKRHTLAQTTFFGDFQPDAFSRKPMHKFHRRHLSQLLTEEPICNEHTVLTTVFTMNPAFPPKSGTVIWVGFPNQDAASQSPNPATDTKRPMRRWRSISATPETTASAGRSISTGITSSRKPTSMSSPTTLRSTCRSSPEASPNATSPRPEIPSTTISMCFRMMPAASSMPFGRKVPSRPRTTSTWSSPEARTVGRPGRNPSS